MSEKNLLILERSNANLSQSISDDGAVILEGVFTEFGIKNKNNRIYEESEVLPHINELQEKVKTSKLLGELDHPKDFEISLSTVSHVVESLEYDKSKKQVIGRIRLLNTSKGKEAQALVKDGIPLHISSRAAGTVDDSGRVKIKKFFTYDLVADPGFANAELSRVNESLGFENDNSLFIYEMLENKKIENKKEVLMENQKFVTVEDFQKYTEYIQNYLSDIKESSNLNDSSELIENLIKYTEHIAEKVNGINDYTEYVAEQLDKSITYSEHIAENVNNNISYSKYLAEKLNDNISYAEYVAEQLDKNISYSEYVAEQVDKNINYSEYVAENLDNAIGYSNYLGENLDKNLAYSEYIAEQLDKNISYSNYLAENIDKNISYSEYIAENVKVVETNQVEPIQSENKSATSYKQDINDKLNQIIESAKNKVSSDLHFMNFLSESKKNEFRSLSEEKQQLIVESMNSKPIMSTVQAENIWESCFVEKKRSLNFIDDMPEKYRTKWESLSESRQAQIISESKFYSLNTPYSINNFWATRDLRPTKVGLEMINESKTAAEQIVQKEPLINESFAADLINRVKFNLGR